MSSILITGGTGLIGAALIDRLLPNHEVHALVHRLPDAPENRVRWIEHDLSSPSLPEDRLPKAIDAVIHLAQSRHYREFPAKALDIMEVSAGATLRLLDWARRVGASHFVGASTGGLYGTPPERVTEASPLAPFAGPLSCYFASKLASEEMIACYRDIMRTAILRFFFVYGAHQRDAMLIPRLVRSVLDGRAIQLQGDEGILINPLHVSDAAAAIEACLTLEGHELVNVAGGEVVSLRRIGEIIGRELGIEPRFDLVAGATPNSLVADTAKMQRLLTTPRVTLDEGLAELCRQIRP